MDGAQLVGLGISALGLLQVGAIFLLTGIRSEIRSLWRSSTEHENRLSFMEGQHEINHGQQVPDFKKGRVSHGRK